MDQEYGITSKVDYKKLNREMRNLKEKKERQPTKSDVQRLIDFYRLSKFISEK